jgi:hypothetical protein
MPPERGEEVKNAEEKEEGGKEGNRGTTRSIEAVLSFLFFVLIKNYLVLLLRRFF